MQFSRELDLIIEHGALGHKSFSDPVSRELLLEKDAFDRMAKPLASSGPDTIHLRSKDILTKSFFTKIKLLSTGSDNTIKNTIVQFSIFDVKNAKLAPFGYFIEYIEEGAEARSPDSSEERTAVTSFFDWYSINEFLRVDEDDRISRNLDVVFDSKYIIFDKSSVFDAEKLRFSLLWKIGDYSSPGHSASVRSICSSIPRKRWLPPLMWRLRGVKRGRFKRAVS